MISDTEALERILNSTSPGQAERLPLDRALGRFFAEPIPATTTLPPLDNSAMDGYAVRFGESLNRWQLTGEQPAGRALNLSLAPGECIRIFTGAPLPANTDAVLMQEDANVKDGWVHALETPRPNEFIRRAGSDVCIGQQLTHAGETVSPAAVGMLASQGITKARVGCAPSVCILSTGNELCPADTTLLPPGCIYESNARMLESLLQQNGISNVQVLGPVADEQTPTREAIAEGLSSDFLLICGGMSVGAHDCVKPALLELGVQSEFWRVAVRPGKPMLFARHHQCHLFGLPGNPVSTFVSFLLFVIPSLRTWMGSKKPSLPGFQSVALEEMANPGNRAHYCRGNLNEEGFRPWPRQESHQLSSLAACNALVRVAPESTISEGQRVTALLYGG